MWARRCGAPPRWPSRVKVLFFSFSTAALAVTIYQFMDSCDIGYLDLSAPASEEVRCYAKWPLKRGHNTWNSWVQPASWEDWMLYTSDQAEYERLYACKNLTASKSKCSLVDVPLIDMQRQLGAPMGSHGAVSLFGYGVNTLDGYAYLFLVLAVGLWLGVVIHDNSLLCQEGKNNILDVQGLKLVFPSLKRVLRLVVGWRFIKSLVTKIQPRILGITLAVLCSPIVVVWSIVVFLLAIMPLMVLMFACYPVRMSRCWLFLNCLACGLYGIVLTIHQIVLLNDVSQRPQYAVTWRRNFGLGDDDFCTCGCVFPISSTICGRLLMIGIGATIQSLMLGFRSLKGLRRANWANLMSVTFAVPMNVYGVEWTQPDGRPIRFRKEGDPVQGEPAFDPFAMMDEQPESASTLLNLKPEPLFEETISGPSPTRSILGPLPTRLEKKLNVTRSEAIGCCGFPYFTGGMKGRYDLSAEDSDLTDSDQAATEEIDKGPAGSGCIENSASSAEGQACQNVLPQHSEEATQLLQSPQNPQKTVQPNILGHEASVASE